MKVKKEEGKGKGREVKRIHRESKKTIAFVADTLLDLNSLTTPFSVPSDRGHHHRLQSSVEELHFGTGTATSSQ